MKRYERMTKEEIIEAFKSTEWCNTCMFRNSKNECTREDKGCCEAMRDYLNEEIKLKTVSRWQVIKSDEDMKKMQQDFREMCRKHKCDDCFYAGDGITACFVNYLLEKNEVEET